MDQGEPSGGPRRNWKVVLGFGLVSVLVGAVLVIGGAAGLAWTSTEQFCIGCHEMRDNVYAEYKGTIHDTNRSGVRAICTDCHVPREVGPLLLRKMRATFEVIGHLRGVIDTKDVVFFVLFIAFFMFLTLLSLSSRKWRGVR